MDRIINMMETMPELSDEQIVELQNEIISEFESVESEEPTPQTVEAMTSLADMLDSVRSEVQRREVQAKELAVTASEASARVYGKEVEAATENTEENSMHEDKDMPEKTEVEVETETPVEDDAEGMEKDKDKKKPMMASAEADEVPAAEETSTATEEVLELSTEEESTATEEVLELSTEEESTATEEVLELSTEEAEEPEEIVAEEAAVVVEDAVELSAEEPETPTDAPVEVQEENVEATVTAAIDAQDITPEVPADRRPASATSAIPVAITAGADIPGVTAGTELSNMSDVADAFAKRLHGLRRVNGGDGEQHIVASFSTAYPEAMQLGSDAEANMEKIKDAPVALTASGSYQSPFATRYDVYGLGTNARPVRDSLPSFQADRGGIRYIVPPVLSSYGSAVGVWTTALDTAYVTNSATSSATKANLVVTAATETTAVADAVTLQMQFGNLATRAYPELIARHNELGLIQHAREAEENILAALTSGSTAVTSTNVLGLGVDFLLQIGRAAAQYRARHRMDDNAALRVIAPAWIKAAIQADFALQMPGDDKLSVADAEIESFMRARNVNVTFHLDDANAYAAQSGSAAINEFHDTFTWFMFAEGTFLFLDGGTLDLGVIRDSTLVGTNDYKMFVETFEGIAKVGVESLRVVSTISINGARSALRDTLAGTASATVEF